MKFWRNKRRKLLALIITVLAVAVLLVTGTFAFPESMLGFLSEGFKFQSVNKFQALETLNLAAQQNNEVTPPQSDTAIQAQPLDQLPAAPEAPETSSDEIPEAPEILSDEIPEASETSSDEIAGLDTVDASEEEVAAAQDTIPPENLGGGIPALSDTQIFNTVSLDGVDWIVLKKITTGGQKYAMLVASEMGTPTYFQADMSPDNSYEGSLPQAILTDYYAAASQTIKANAVVPNLAPNDKASVSYPTATLAYTSGQKKDIFFSLSHMEVNGWPTQYWGGNGGVIVWWLRTPVPGSNSQGYFVHTLPWGAGDIEPWDVSSTSFGPFNVRPAVWVKY